MARTPSLEFTKQKNPATQNSSILKELRKGNPSFRRSGRRKKIPDLSISNLTSAEHALIRNRGRRFEIATFSRCAPRLICDQKKDRRFHFDPSNTRLSLFS